jgi:hypothetical protein
MRKILLALTCTFLFSTVILAQSTRFGVTGGVVYSTMFSKINGEKDLSNFKFGGTVGVMADVPMEKNGSFRTGVNFVQKGGKNETTDGTDKIEESYRLNYIEVPLLVLFNIPCKTDGKIRLGGGVTPGFAISGKYKYEVNGAGDEEDIDFGDKTDSDLNWMDFSLNFQAEYEFSNGVFLSLGWSQGINRLFVSGSEKDKLYNHYAGLRVGYFFGKK